jgi:hypothetical protein
MVQVVEGPTSKHEALSLNLSTIKKKNLLMDGWTDATQQHPSHPGV